MTLEEVSSVVVNFCKYAFGEEKGFHKVAEIISWVLPSLERRFSFHPCSFLFNLSMIKV